MSVTETIRSYNQAGILAYCIIDEPFPYALCPSRIGRLTIIGRC